MKERNPIAIKLQSLLDTGQMTKEKICVAADIRYPALANIWVRPHVSKLNIKSLLYKRIITQEDVDTYQQWLIEKGLFGLQGAKRGRKKIEKLKSPKFIDSNEDRRTQENDDDDGA